MFFKSFLHELYKNKHFIHCACNLRQIDGWQQPVLKTITSEWDHNWDQRDISKANNAVRYLMLINHGEFKNGELTNKGLNQVYQVAERLNYLNYAVSYILHTGSEQTQQSAEVIQESITFRKPPLMKCSLMKEAENVAVESTSSATIPSDVRYQNEILVEAAFRKHFYRPEPDHQTTFEVIVAYPSIINYFVCRALQLSSHAWGRFAPPFGSITILSVAGRSVQIDAFGDVGHLNLDLIPKLV